MHALSPHGWEMRGRLHACALTTQRVARVRASRPDSMLLKMRMHEKRAREHEAQAKLVQAKLECSRCGADQPL